MSSKRKWFHNSKRTRDADEGDSIDTHAVSSDIEGESKQRLGRPKKARLSALSLGQVKGHQAVVGTCDVRNDRTATAELVDLLNSYADKVYQSGSNEAVDPPLSLSSSYDADDNKIVSKGSMPAAEEKVISPNAEDLSVQERVRREAEALRAGLDKSQRFISVNTSVKGVVMVCVMDAAIDVVQLVDGLFADIRATGKRRSRFLERMTPLKVTSFSEIEVFKIAAEPTVLAALPPVAEPLPQHAPKVAKKPASDGSEETTAVSGVSNASKAPMHHAKDCTATHGGDQARGENDAPGDKASGEDAPTGGVPRPETGPDTPEGLVGSCTSDDVQSNVTGPTPESNSAQGAGSAAKTCEKRFTFRVDVRRRNSGLKRLDLINAVATSVGTGHSVSMSSPDVTIVVEAIKSVVGTSVLFNYARNHEYSISRLQDAVCGDILQK